MRIAFKKTVFVTGATGFIGCHLIARFLKNGYRVIALSREKEGRSPQQRLHEAISRVDRKIEITKTNLITVSGDMTGDGKEWIRQIRKQISDDIDEVWHLAAIFKISKQTQEEVESININGVNRIIDFMRNVNSGTPPRYFHVSTAYSQGRSFHVVAEKLYESELDFRSLYDWSKNGGERLVAESQKQYGLDVTILRPSIVVSSPGSKVVNNAAYYTVLETLYSVRQRAAVSLGENFNGHLGVRFWAEPACRLNMVPVNFVIDGMCLISQHEELVGQGLKIFNIVNENPPLLKFLFDIGCESVNVSGFELVNKDVFMQEPMTPLEKLFDRRIGFQAPYTRENISFSMEKFRKIVSADLLPPPVIDDVFLRDINKNFIEVHEGKLALRESSEETKPVPTNAYVNAEA